MRSCATSSSVSVTAVSASRPATGITDCTSRRTFGSAPSRAATRRAEAIESSRPTAISSARDSTPIAFTGLGRDTSESWNARRNSTSPACRWRIR